jgi:hypothetical protein
VRANHELTQAASPDCTGLSLPASQITDVPSCGVLSKSSPNASYGSAACPAYVVEWQKSSGAYLRVRASPIDSEYPTTEAECNKWRTVTFWGYERIVPPGGGTPYWTAPNPNPPYNGTSVLTPWWSGSLCVFQPFPGYLAYWEANGGNPYQSKFRTAAQAYYKPSGSTNWQLRRVKLPLT